MQQRKIKRKRGWSSGPRCRLWEKVYRGTREDGTRWEKIVKWFGYKLHLIVDASYELPIMFSVTKASVPDINEAHHLLEKMEERQPEILKKLKY